MSDSRGFVTSNSRGFARWAALAGLLVLYGAGVVLVAALLSVPLQGVLAGDGADGGPELRRVVHRLAQVLALVALFPLLALTGGSDARAWGLGAAPPRRWLAEAAAGFAAGIASLGLLASLLLSAGLRVPQPGLAIEAGWLAGVVGGALLTAVLVSLVEETWFRGGLHTVAERLCVPLAAIAVTSTIFALLHFVRPAPLPAGAIPGPLDGLRAMAGSLERLADVGMVGSLLALVAAGVCLALARLHTGRIAACIGLHAGWVVVIRVLKKTTHMSADPLRERLVDGYDGVIGWVALAWLAALALGYAWMMRARLSRGTDP
jgi:membrane protease YdiL (CAAX protease family)